MADKVEFRKPLVLCGNVISTNANVHIVYICSIYSHKLLPFKYTLMPLMRSTQANNRPSTLGIHYPCKRSTSSIKSVGFFLTAEDFPPTHTPLSKKPKSFGTQALHTLSRKPL